MRHFLYGYFGQKNTGDDAMLWCWLNKMNHNDTAYVLSKEPCYVPRDKSIVFVPYNPLKAIVGLIKADNFTVVGGTHFSNYGKMHRNFLITLRILAVCVLAKLFRKKVYFDAIGIVCGNWWLALMLLITCRFVDRVTVRDKTSQIILNTIGVKAEEVPDLASGLVDKITWLKNSDTLGVNVSPLNKIFFDCHEADDKHLKEIADIINRSDYKKVKLIVFREGDTEHTLKLQRLLIKESKIIRYKSNPAYALNEIAECSHVLAQKYHACYYAKLAGVLFTNIGTHPKNWTVK